jgi:hypothetical protein
VNSASAGRVCLFVPKKPFQLEALATAIDQPAVWGVVSHDDKLILQTEILPLLARIFFVGNGAPPSPRWPAVPLRAGAQGSQATDGSQPPVVTSLAQSEFDGR